MNRLDNDFSVASRTIKQAMKVELRFFSYTRTLHHLLTGLEEPPEFAFYCSSLYI
uniref:Uncharacterized protein n=1 Tax=Lepeophtheirus salmonis TaxID=72036 RepID=A0A0K2V866_LEPSM